jgi:hypothetical protein
LNRLSSPRALCIVWLTLTILAAVAMVLAWTTFEPPTWLPTAGACTVSTTYASGLAVRTGGRPLVAGALAVVVTVTAVVSGLPVLLAGSAVCTAALAAVLSVMATKAAAGFAGVLRECLIAIVLAGVGAFAVEAYQAPVSPDRTRYLVLGLSLLGALGLVYRLGAGLHGLGRRGAIMVIGGIGLLFVTLAYTEALAHWGSPTLIDNLHQATADIRSEIGAVPRPIEFLLSFPALAWGISTRARRRQGWWVCAFAAAGLAVVSLSLLNPRTSLAEAGLSLAYSAALGLALGYLVIRADKFLTGARGRRARRLEEASAHRPEPDRIEALL